MAIKCPKCNADNPDTKQYCGDCGTHLTSPDFIPDVTKTLETPAPYLARGTKFADRYEIIEQLGMGGMGNVYRVEDTKIHEEVALKLLKSEIASSKRTIERFRNELRLARKIRHKNVCQMFDLGEDEGTHFITMEYVSGEDLKSFIRRSKQLSMPTAISVTKQICEGLEEAHKLGIVHRDLKPSNIMVDKNGNVHIMDFGIARSVRTESITGTGVMIGTPEYMSPEQVESKTIDHRSDIYSLGVILYEMATGRLPFEGDTALSIARKHADKTPINPQEINPQIPDDLNHLILKCLEKDEEKRYQSAGDLRAELENIEKGIPTTASEIPRTRSITSRDITVQFSVKKFFVPVAALIVLISAALIIWKLLPRKGVVPIQSDKPTLAVMYFQNNTGDESLEHFRGALSDLLIEDLNQSKYIRALSGDMLFSILGHLNLLEAERYSSEDLKEVANRGKATHIVQGSYIKVGETIRVSITIQEANTMELLASERIEGKADDVLTMVDELTKKIKSNFEVSDEEIADDTDNAIKDITTSSSDAYMFYAQGNKYHEKQEYDKAILFYQSAIKIDAKFAQAYQKLAMIYESLGEEDEMLKCMEKFLELSN